VISAEVRATASIRSHDTDEAFAVKIRKSMAIVEENQTRNTPDQRPDCFVIEQQMVEQTITSRPMNRQRQRT